VFLRIVKDFITLDGIQKTWAIANSVHQEDLDSLDSDPQFSYHTCSLAHPKI